MSADYLPLNLAEFTFPTQLLWRARSIWPSNFTRVFGLALAHAGLMRKNGLVAKSPAKAETKAGRADREARERLEHADMGLFDRFMRRLVSGQRPAPEKDNSLPTGKNKR